MDVTRKIRTLEKTGDKAKVAAFLALAAKEEVDLRAWEKRLATLQAKVGIKSWKVGVKVKGETHLAWVYNGQRWPSYALAVRAGDDLRSRWMAVELLEVHPSDDEPNQPAS